MAATEGGQAASHGAFGGLLCLPDGSNPPAGSKGRPKLRWLHITVVAVLAIAFLIFALQNLQSVTVAFLGISFTWPLAILFVVVYLLGMATGGGAWSLIRWAWQGSRPPTAAAPK
jgi:putative membrane protein